MQKYFMALNKTEFTRLINLATKKSKLKTDIEKIQFMIENKNDVKIWLDNDGTSMNIKIPKEATEKQSDQILDAEGNDSFDKWFGGGLEEILLNHLGITDVNDV